jgi:RNA ligase
VDAKGNVVARPFKKFFNLAEHNNPDLERLPVGMPFKTYEKLDGSLGISYRSSRGWEIATRGSFESEQAIFATALLSKKYSEALALMDPDFTFLFEIIFPQNRIVVNYGDAQELVLLGVMRVSDGVELPLEEFCHLPFRQPHVFDTPDIDSLPCDTQNFEGYVIRFENGLRVKVKLDSYVRLHKLMTGITANSVWELLSSGQDVDAVISELPDEMHNEIRDIADDIRNSHMSQLIIHTAVLRDLQLEGLSRKEQAAKILKCHQQRMEVEGFIVQLCTSVLFLLLDKQFEQAKKKLWNLVKPTDGHTPICKAALKDDN